MKVAVTSQGKDLASTVDPRFGRARYFVVADTETSEFEAVDNEQNLNAAQGAGIQSAQCVAGLGVEAVLTGHCGPKAFQALSAGGIAIYLVSAGTVGEALDKLKSGAIAPIDSADVDGHW
jgi:predicted Fe-Mo cluster-binding NifX family protein